MTKKIEAIIREEKLNDVKVALQNIGIVGMNVMECRGHGRQGGIELVGRTGPYKVDLLPRLQINIVLSDHNLEKAIETIRAENAEWRNHYQRVLDLLLEKGQTAMSPSDLKEISQAIN